jgi:hypothetical protein
MAGTPPITRMPPEWLEGSLWYDRIPIERTWEMCWILHEFAGHPEEEMMFCNKCEATVNRLIRVLFDQDAAER